MDLTAYQAAMLRTASPLTKNQMLHHALHGIAAECGEIHALFQKEYQGHELSRRALAEEIGDLLWFVAELCEGAGLSRDGVACGNVEKLKRRYPAGFSAERSRNRADEREDSER